MINPSCDSVAPNVRSGLLGRPRVLVIEDDEDLALGLRLMLGRNYEVYTASSAREASELFEVDRPDVLIVDYQLPDSNGIRLLQSIQRHHGEPPPAVMLSAYGSRRAASIDAGFATFLQKPCDSLELVWAIEQAIAQI